MGDLGEPNARVELGSLPSFLHQSVNRWKKDTSGEDDWGPNPIDNLIGFAHAVQVSYLSSQLAKCACSYPDLPLVVACGSGQSHGLLGYSLCTCFY